MNCPACQRENHPARRYCGRCGCNFVPACEHCGFDNEPDDRFCGGCGEPLHSSRLRRPAAQPAVIVGPVPRTVPTGATAAVTGAAVWEASELAELFAPAAPAEQAPDLPEAGVSQDHLDKLFGGTP